MKPCPSCGLPYQRNPSAPFVEVGGAYVRAGLIATVSEYVVTLTDGTAVALGDDQTAAGVLAEVTGEVLR